MKIETVKKLFARQIIVDPTKRLELKTIAFFALLALAMSMGTTCSYADPIPDDTALFTAAVPPYTLVILDMSGSMSCKVNGTYCGRGGEADAPDDPTQRKISIARKIFKDLLDVNNDFGNKLNVKLGYMRFNGVSGPRDLCNNDSDGDPTKGKIRVLADMGSSDKLLWNKIKDPHPECSDGPDCEFTGTTDVAGCTPLAATLAEAKTYFDGQKDTAIECRKRFIIYITDGGDNLACSIPNPPVCDSCSADCDDYTSIHYNKGRVATVLNAKKLYEPDNPNIPKVRVFVVGFASDTSGGGMPESDKRFLNWVAKYGGTDNFLEPNSGDPTKYNLTDILSPYGNDPCNVPASDTQAGKDADPGYYDDINPQAGYPLYGYAFLTRNGSELSQAITAILYYISERSLTFTTPGIPSFRTDNGNNNTAYISSFIALEDRPLWRGTLQAYPLADGLLPLKRDQSLDDSKKIWDVGFDLMSRPLSSRNIYTYLGESTDLTASSNVFTKANPLITDQLLGVPKEDLIDFIRCADSYDWNENRDRTEKRDWLLGDIFHSNPTVVGPPSRFFDPHDASLATFYESQKTRTKVVIAGANDGMLHVFHAGTFSQAPNEGEGGYDQGTGKELWAFIPPSLMGKLHLMTSKAAPHPYYVDSSPKVADVKIAGNWKTVLICGLRKGGKSYFALDITDISRPQFLWEFSESDMGETWSEPSIGKVRVGSQEKWVVFFGGGFDKNNASGKAFYIMDVGTGRVFHKFAGLSRMDYSLAASPTVVDLNADGYIDRVYIGDLHGQMWVFDISSNDTANWQGKILLTADQVKTHSIYDQPTVAFDRERTPWVFFGTGDGQDVTDKNIEGKFYAVKDDGAGGYGENNLRPHDLTTDRNTSNTFNPPQEPLKGWYFTLPKGEKVLAKPVVSNRLLYFTTYTSSASPNLCRPSGDARLYVVQYLSGGGAFVLDDYLNGMPSDRSKLVGSGIPSPPVISVDSEGDIVVTTATSGSVGDGGKYDQRRGPKSILKRMLYWREMIP